MYIIYSSVYCIGDMLLFMYIFVFCIGISVLLLDLDVGFLQSPGLLYDGYTCQYVYTYVCLNISNLYILRSFFEDPYEQLRAQMDVGSCMNKSAGNTWFTQPLTNFGLFLIKPHEYSIKVSVQ